MIKGALLGVAAVAAVIAGEMGADKVLAMREGRSTAAVTKATEARKTHEINVPRIKDGAIKGYAVMLLSYTVDLNALKTAAMAPDSILVDEAFRYVYSDDTIDFDHLDRFDFAKMSKALAHGDQRAGEERRDRRRRRAGIYLRAGQRGARAPGALGRSRRVRLGRGDQIDEPPEEIMAVARARRGLGMILHGEGRPVGERNAAIRAVEQRHMRFLGVRGQARPIDREAVVHRHDLDLAGGEVLHRMVRAVMALRHLDGLRADREPQQLMAETDAEQGNLRLQERLDGRHGVFAGGGRIARPVGEHDPVGLERQDVLGARRRRHHRHRAADSR